LLRFDEEQVKFLLTPLEILVVATRNRAGRYFSRENSSKPRNQEGDFPSHHTKFLSILEANAFFLIFISKASGTARSVFQGTGSCSAKIRTLSKIETNFGN
jgi:hypothetical protein